MSSYQPPTAIHQAPKSAPHREGGKSQPLPSPPLNQALTLQCIKPNQTPTSPSHLRSSAPWDRGQCPPEGSPNSPQHQSSQPRDTERQVPKAVLQKKFSRTYGQADRQHPIASLSHHFAFLTYLPNYCTSAGSHLSSTPPPPRCSSML